MYTLMIFWTMGYSAQVHTSPMEFVNETQCRVAAAQIAAQTKDKVKGEMIFVCIPSGATK